MLAIFPLFLMLGLFLPGFFVAKYLRHRLWGASAFVISLLILFHCVFWLGVFGIPIMLWTVAPLLIAASGAAAWGRKRFAPPAKTPATAPWNRLDRALILSTALVGAVLMVHSVASPLIGPDTLFRWDFLAQRMLALGRFDFYPPLTPADFRTYFYVDGIPPMVSFTHWWMYASAGRYLPWLISVFVAAQFVCTLVFTYGAAAALFSRRAGVLAAAILAASPFYFKAVLLGQETGLTALSVAAMTYFIVSARQPEIPAADAAGAAGRAGSTPLPSPAPRPAGTSAPAGATTAPSAHSRRRCAVEPRLAAGASGGVAGGGRRLAHAGQPAEVHAGRDGKAQWRRHASTGPVPGDAAARAGAHQRVFVDNADNYTNRRAVMPRPRLCWGRGWSPAKGHCGSGSGGSPHRRSRGSASPPSRAS